MKHKLLKCRKKVSYLKYFFADLLDFYRFSRIFLNSLELDIKKYFLTFRMIFYKTFLILLIFHFFFRGEKMPNRRKNLNKFSRFFHWFSRFFSWFSRIFSDILDYFLSFLDVFSCFSWIFHDLNEYLLNGSGVKKWTFFKRSQIFF